MVTQIKCVTAAVAAGQYYMVFLCAVIYNNKSSLLFLSVSNEGLLLCYGYTNEIGFLGGCSSSWCREIEDYGLLVIFFGCYKYNNIIIET